MTFQIVLGGANYSSILPENSYIDVMNFSSPKHLSEYLKRVSNDKTLYNSYFKWKKKYCVKDNEIIDKFCKLCEHLRYKSNEKRVWDNQKQIENWFTIGSNCSRMVFSDNEIIRLVKT